LSTQSKSDKEGPL